MRAETAWAVVPAGGRGARMGRKKQEVRLGGWPVLRWTLEVFERSREIQGVVVAVPREDVSRWRRWLRACRKVRAVVAGGRERQASVRRALGRVPATVRWVVVHDGVRPCLTPGLLRDVLRAARRHGAAVAARPVAETLKREVGGWVGETVPRDGLWAVQTPQVFRADDLREAHRRALAEGVYATDDAALVERLGVRVRLVPGRPENLKLTRPEDLSLARILLGARRRGGRRT